MSEQNNPGANVNGWKDGQWYELPPELAGQMLAGVSPDDPNRDEKLRLIQEAMQAAPQSDGGEEVDTTWALASTMFGDAKANAAPAEKPALLRIGVQNLEEAVHTAFELRDRVDRIIADLHPQAVPNVDASAAARRGLNGVKDRYHRMSKLGRAVTVTGLATAIAAGAGATVAAASPLWETSSSTCANPQNKNIEEEVNATSWTTAANTISHDRYPVDARELALLNNYALDTNSGQIVVMRAANADGSLKDDMQHQGDLVCLRVPAMLVHGQTISNGETPQQIADRTGADVNDVMANNKGLATAPDKPITAGARVWLTDQIDTSMGLLPYNGDMTAQLGDNPQAAAVKLVNANADQVDVTNIQNSGDTTTMGLVFRKDKDYMLIVDKEQLTDYMNEHNLTYSQIMQAYEKLGAYDPVKRGKALIVTPAPQPTSSPEASAPTNLTAEQAKIINAMPGLDATQRKATMAFVSAMMRQRALLEKNNVNPAVLMSQFALESAWGTSGLATGANNYLGMACPDDGCNGMDHFAYKGNTWHKFASIDDNIAYYVQSLSSYTAAYGDALQHPYDDAIYASGLQNTLSPNGHVAQPFDHEKSVASYCDCENYDSHLLDIIDRNNMDGLFNNWVFAIGPRPVHDPNVARRNAEQKSSGSYPSIEWLRQNWVLTPLDPTPYTGPGQQITINRSIYQQKTKHQGELGGRQGGATVLMPDGNTRVPLTSLDDSTRMMLINHALSGVNLSLDGYRQWQTAYNQHDDGSYDERNYPNFNGGDNGLGRVTNAKTQIPWLVNHNTITDDSGNYIGGQAIDGKAAAREMQVGTDGIGSYAYTNADGVTYKLVTNSRVVDVLDFNMVTWGNENAAGGQEAITSAQYTSDVYWFANMLESYGYVQKGQSVTDIVNRVVRGHAEFSEISRNDHGDMPQMVMDWIRKMVVYVLVQDGYNA